jgi:amino acid transporter
MLVSPTDPSLNLASTAAKSPFVIAIQNSGIQTLPSIINAVLLSSAWSAGCADLYISSRALYGLYTRGAAPKFVGKLRKDGLPWVCVVISAALSLLSFMAADSDGKAGTVFGYCKLMNPRLLKTISDRTVANMTSVCGMISWAGISWTAIRWNKALRVQGIDRNTLPFKAPFQPYLSYYALTISIMVIIFGGFTTFSKFNTTSND